MCNLFFFSRSVKIGRRNNHDSDEPDQMTVTEEPAPQLSFAVSRVSFSDEGLSIFIVVRLSQEEKAPSPMDFIELPILIFVNDES